ncbi:ArsR/SmtB family transcription factor [Ornithinimicrobium murale]|uniref:ArsR/SmtB family transcription factor n=1 Tax=Ornithinimicrobium murale TaxID=1050153 RepID=UPI000E0DFB3B|nr:metalloregulator ArsR/SmtB family transcription factor [Ornithinimicrobium murale]
MVNQEESLWGEAGTEVFAALGDPRRALILTLLAQRDRTVSELAAHLPISLPGTLKHLAVLESAGLVNRSKTGRTVTVTLQPERLQDAEEWLHRARTFWASQLGNLARSFTPPSKETP